MTNARSVADFPSDGQRRVRRWRQEQTVALEYVDQNRQIAAGLRDGEGLPEFVAQEFRDVLRCGWLAGGFARLRCTRLQVD
jgi:hypothetical protein